MLTARSHTSVAPAEGPRLLGDVGPACYAREPTNGLRAEPSRGGVLLGVLAAIAELGRELRGGEDGEVVAEDKEVLIAGDQVRAAADR